MLEILAPAGNKEMLRAAVFSGADCVYLGVKGFNARRSAQNFSENEQENSLKNAVEFCHGRNCGVYAAVNTLVRPGEEDMLKQALMLVKNAGCDAVIVQDLQTAVLAQQLGLEVHASTQMSVHSLQGVLQLAELGFSRAILARELSLSEIEYIAQRSPIELEVFVHGALCVSVSGQCYMSAFLGGRQADVRGANAGACASPCRLPFKVRQMAANEEIGGALKLSGAKDGEHALSLKDLSIIDSLPRLEEIGVKSAKIEGRLRGPEYCAAVVDAAKKALHGEHYDKEFLQNIFSRSGFTDGWFNPQKGVCVAGCGAGAMFGTRTAEQSGLSKKALPAARQLYRREMPRVGVKMSLELSANGAQLTVNDGANSLCKAINLTLETAQVQNDAQFAQTLGKTGGTPFYLSEEAKISSNGFYVAPAALSALRREALEELLLIREHALEESQNEAVIAIENEHKNEKLHIYSKNIYLENNGRPKIRASFLSVKNMPENAAEICSEIILPIEEYEQIPQEIRSITRLSLPRLMFGEHEEKTHKLVENAREKGFERFEVHNIAHFSLCKEADIASSGGLNITNTVALGEYAKLGLKLATLSVELNARQIELIAKESKEKKIAATDILVYGRLPLMLTRSCPVQYNAVLGSGRAEKKGACSRRALLIDRVGAQFPIICEKGGWRSIYNSVPLWHLDKLDKLNSNYASLLFTVENKKQAQEILNQAAAACGGQKAYPPQNAFTRGFY